MSGRLSSPQAWSAAKSGRNQWYQIDLGSVQWVGGVATKGRGNYPQWVTKYRIRYSKNGKEWKWAGGKHAPWFKGNHDRNTLKEHVFPHPIKIRFIRIYVVKWHAHVSMRVGLTKCKWPPAPPPPKPPPPPPPWFYTPPHARMPVSFDQVGKYKVCYRLAPVKTPAGPKELSKCPDAACTVEGQSCSAGWCCKNKKWAKGRCPPKPATEIAGNYTQIGAPFVVKPVFPKNWTSVPVNPVAYKPVKVTFTGGAGLQLAPGKDVAKIVSINASCTEKAKPWGGSAEVKNLGPDDSLRATVATANFQFEANGKYKVCYKMQNNEYAQVDDKVLVVNEVMEMSGCMTVGNMPVSEMANPKVQKSFESAISGASGGAPTTTTPKEKCGDEDYMLSYDTLMGEGISAHGKKKGKKGGVVKSSVTFVTSDIPKAFAGKAKAGLTKSVSSGSLLKSVASKAANLGIKLPPPINLGMTVSVKRQPPRPEHSYDPFIPRGVPTFTEPPAPNVTNTSKLNTDTLPISLDPKMKTKTVPAGVFPNVQGKYDTKTGSWLTADDKSKKVDPAAGTSNTDITELGAEFL